MSRTSPHSASWPIAVQLEITDRCNMGCPMCISSDHCDSPREPVLDTDFIRERLLRPLRKRGVTALGLSGGEPTISPCLIEVIETAKELGYRIFLATNALTERVHRFSSILEALSGGQEAVVQVSFDSMYPEEMRVIRGGNYYEAVLSNLRELRRMTREASGGIRLVSCIVVQEENAGSFPETVDFLLDEVGVDRVILQLRHDFSNIDRTNWMRQAPLDLGEKAKMSVSQNIRHVLGKYCGDNRVRIMGSTAENWDTFLRKPTDMPVTCNAAKLVFVDPYGNLRGCLNSRVIGNLKETDIDTFLESRAYEDFLDFMRECNICIHGCSV